MEWIQERLEGRDWSESFKYNSFYKFLYKREQRGEEVAGERAESKWVLLF